MKRTACFGAIVPRQIKGLLAVTRPAAEPGVAGGDVDENGLGGAADDVLEGGRVHEQLPVVLMGRKIERNLVGACALCRQRWRGANECGGKKGICNRSKHQHRSFPCEWQSAHGDQWWRFQQIFCSQILLAVPLSPAAGLILSGATHPGSPFVPRQRTSVGKQRRASPNGLSGYRQPAQQAA